ncbi:4-fold beta flower protein [Thiocystis violacea]|uniref:4-fold beta flower protein n=1 Tax=Thiocystis violacea TaxID=13725 RepID=UPI00190809AF|nr:hypothetical protein [Thiocystis violacea]
MKKLLLVILLPVMFSFYPLFAKANEISLYSYNGEAVAYIAFNDESTIYLWSGEPVAYLSYDSAGGYHVYGFNGKHLGWFVRGVIWDHQGYAACAVKEAIGSTQFESFKAFKQFKPFKSFKEFAPFRPTFFDSFGDTPCKIFLSFGSGN